MDSYIQISTVFFGSAIIAMLASAVFKQIPNVVKDFRSLLTELKLRVESHLSFGEAKRTKPLTRAEVKKLYPEGTWQRTSYDEYVKVLLDEELVFPCIYATKGFKSDDQVYLFIDTDDLSNPRHIRTLADGLADYLPKARSLGPNTSLVLLAKQNDSPRSMEEYNASFWKLLDGLARLDEKPWPSNIPTQIDHERWCFCFGGEPFFTVIQTPAHQQRRTRYAKGLTIVFQPKWIFDILFSSDAKRAASLAKVRALLAKYDPIPVSPDLKNYGDPDSREFEQYFLLDENVSATSPYKALSPSEISTSFSGDAKRAASLVKAPALLAKYDPILVNPALKNYDDPNSRDFDQYFLPDENVATISPDKLLSSSKVLKA
ncbi:YqcI/YcgG family-domain-containing protein [Crucibulum laeve]|uniref:YqcI/YcgG family-domain-containing protein n=1 Tax=Crucibulum laeve TaxID=68775 RepID=A0A5C3LTI4_9AGAR|nr:YqcI/YcgG family-domain-containing protein [Crucibulum laeve]